MSEYVNIDPEQVASGASQWSAAADDLGARWRSAVNAIEALNAAQPWGGDAAGAAFRSVYQPEETLSGAAGIIEEAARLGPAVAQAAALSAAADEQQAAQMNVPVSGT